jgi:hypothetical protein
MTLRLRFAAIERYITGILKAVPGVAQVNLKKTKRPTSKFSNLKDNDILFTDSSHLLKIGSPMQRIFRHSAATSETRHYPI